MDIRVCTKSAKARPSQTKQYDEQINCNNINNCMKCCDNEKIKKKVNNIHTLQ